MHGSFVSFALGITMLCGMLAIGVDAAYLFADKIGTRSAADLAALAGAKFLPDANSARSKAREISQANGYQHGVNGITVDVNIPPVYGPSAGAADRVEVIITHPASTFFASVLGTYWVDVRGRAVSGLQSAPDMMAIYAHDQNCSGDQGIEWSGQNTLVNGRVHSNSEFKLSGSDNTFGSEVTNFDDDGAHNCNRDIGGSNNQFPPGEPHSTDFEPWPIYFFIEQFPCDWDRNGASSAAHARLAPTGDFDINSDGPWWVGGTPGGLPRLRAGVYCANDGKLTLGTGNVRGEDGTSPASITMVAAVSPPAQTGPNTACNTGGQNGGIALSGDNSQLVADALGVLTFSEIKKKPAMTLSGSGILWEGWHFAPCEQINYSGSTGATVIGGFVAERFAASGSNWNITGTIPGGGSSTLPALFE